MQREREGEKYTQARGKTQCLGSYGLKKVEIRCCYTIYYLLSLSMCAKKRSQKGNS